MASQILPPQVSAIHWRPPQASRQIPANLIQGGFLISHRSRWSLKGETPHFRSQCSSWAPQHQCISQFWEHQTRVMWQEVTLATHSCFPTPSLPEPWGSGKSWEWERLAGQGRLSRKEVEKLGKFEVDELITRQRQKIFQDKYQVLCSKENFLLRVRQFFPTSDKVLAGGSSMHLKDINSEQFRDWVFVQSKADDACKKLKNIF